MHPGGVFLCSTACPEQWPTKCLLWRSWWGASAAGAGASRGSAWQRAVLTFSVPRKGLFTAKNFTDVTCAAFWGFLSSVCLLLFVGFFFFPFKLYFTNQFTLLKARVPMQSNTCSYSTPKTSNMGTHVQREGQDQQFVISSRQSLPDTGTSEINLLWIILWKCKQ